MPDIAVKVICDQSHNCFQQCGAKKPHWTDFNECNKCPMLKGQKCVPVEVHLDKDDIIVVGSLNIGEIDHDNVVWLVDHDFEPYVLEMLNKTKGQKNWEFVY